MSASKPRYRIYGLSVQSDRALPLLVPDDALGAPDVEVQVEDEPLPALGTGEAIHYRLAGELGSIDFGIGTDGRRIRVGWGPGTRFRSLDDVSALLTGPVLRTVLRMHGRTALHAAAIEIGSRAYLLLGSKGSGKSTLTAALARAGHRVIADDVAALTGKSASVEPGYPCLRLAPDTLLAFGFDPDALPRAVTTLDKRHVALTPGEPSPWSFAPKAVPLGGIYVVTRVDAGDPEITTLSGSASLAALLRHVPQTLTPLGRESRADELRRLGALATAVPVRRFRYSSGLGEIDAAANVLVADAMG